MWEAVRRELASLEWDAAPTLTQDLLSEWTRIVHSLVAIRRVLGPVPTHDPLAILATAATGAARTSGVEPVVAPSLHEVRGALIGVVRAMEAAADDDRLSHTAALNHVAYELAHWVRVQTRDERARAWLLAGETALDSAIHTPVDRTSIGVGLAAWRDALSAVQLVDNAAILRRGVALGHLATLRNAHVLVGEAQRSGTLPGPYSDALLGHIRLLARAHQVVLSQIDVRRLSSSRVDQAVMLKLGGAVRQLTGRPDVIDPSRIRLDALLRSSIGEAVVVANITNETSAKPAASNISRLALEYLANPGMLRPESPGRVVASVATPDRPQAPVREPPALVTVGEPSIPPGTVLAGATVMALCRTRDLGVAAATGDAANPPDLLRGIDPSRWPQLVKQGRQAVADLVTSVVPMVYAKSRNAFHAADLQGQMFVELMGAANRFDPQRIGPERWPTYAWLSLEHVRQRGVDQAGVAPNHSRAPRATLVPLGDTEPASREPDPGAAFEERQSTEAIRRALGRLPHSLRGPLLESIQGRSERVIAEDAGLSESTARRRILEAREILKRELVTRSNDADGGAYETATDPALGRSQRMFGETPSASHVEQHRAPYR